MFEVRGCMGVCVCVCVVCVCVFVHVRVRVCERTGDSPWITAFEHLYKA